MAESTLSIRYDDLQVEVGRFLGYAADPDTWSDGQVAEVDRYIQAGIRQFYYPPKVEGVEEGYEWSFLKPVTTIDTVDGDGEQDLPDDFGRIIGDLHFEASVHARSITVVSEHRILALLQQNDDENRPRHAAVRFKSSDGSAGQRQEIVWWPIPDTAYTLTYRYEAFAGKLVKTTNPYPLGGMKHAEVITESCLAIAEQRANDEKGIHWDAFMRLLATAIAQDRKNGARYFGAMSQGETVESDARCRRLHGSSYNITYKGETW
jgi:hypothetical protein